MKKHKITLTNQKKKQANQKNKLKYLLLQKNKINMIYYFHPIFLRNKRLLHPSDYITLMSLVG